jgi:Zn-dependent M28 family amino/carboxypeptidase
VEFSPGGCDDGFGVVILLELFSNLVNDLTVTFSDVYLIVLFTDAEESGLVGAGAFITNHKWRFNIRRFINVDSLSCSEVASLTQTTQSQVFFTLKNDLIIVVCFFCSLSLIIVECQDHVLM